MIISRVTYHTTNSAKQNTHKKKKKKGKEEKLGSKRKLSMPVASTPF